MTVQPRQTPLQGVRVLDFGQFIAIPFCTLWLAWLGAEVIVVESRRRMTSRTAPPFAAGHEGDVNGSGYFNQLGSSKKSCTVDMTTAAGREIVRGLAARSDVIVDNFSTGVMERLGLGYDAVSAVNPSLIMVSCGAFGRSGALKDGRGLHSAVNLFSGVADVTGYEGGAPRILGGVVPDPLGGTYSTFAILAALRHRKRTGEGQYIDVAMYEGMMSLIPEAVIDLTLNGNEPVRAGNRDRMKAPHGIFRCRDDDTWVALSAETDAQWQAMGGASGNDGWRSDPRFADPASRQTHVAALEHMIEAWTRTVTVDEATEILQAAGIPAGPVRSIDQLFDDPQIRARGMVVTVDHPVVGPREQLGLPWLMDSLAADYRPAPLLGEHTRDLLTGLLGYSETEFERLDAAGVLA